MQFAFRKTNDFFLLLLTSLAINCGQWLKMEGTIEVKEIDVHVCLACQLAASAAAIVLSRDLLVTTAAYNSSSVAARLFQLSYSQFLCACSFIIVWLFYRFASVTSIFLQAHILLLPISSAIFQLGTCLSIFSDRVCQTYTVCVVAVVFNWFNFCVVCQSVRQFVSLISSVPLPIG